jgi:hypothetical protein
MSRAALIQAVERVTTDAAFRAQLESDPVGALAGYDLTGEERTALLRRDPAKLQALGVEARVTKQDTGPWDNNPWVGG